MKRAIAILLWITPTLLNAQSGNLPALIATSPSDQVPQEESLLQNFISEFKDQSQRDDVTRLRKVFYQTQRHFLKKYVPYSSFNETVRSGRYDCLTATSLLSIVLGDLGFDYQIVETNYHIFLLVKTTKGEVLLETTDRYDGFVKNEKQIQDRIGKYRSNNGLPDANAYHYHFELYRPVNAQQLPGLLYYNQAVKAFNQGQLEACSDLLAAAQSIYDTPRIEELGSILAKAVANSNLDEAVKKQIIKRFAGRKTSILASR